MGRSGSVGGAERALAEGSWSRVVEVARSGVLLRIGAPSASALASMPAEKIGIARQHEAQVMAWSSSAEFTAYRDSFTNAG